MDIILEQKYVMQIQKESAWAMGGITLAGTLYLVEGGIIFSTQGNIIHKLCNNQKIQGIPRPNELKKELVKDGPLKNCLVITFDELEKVEIGSFKQLWLALTYTLRFHMKDGMTYIFCVYEKSVAEKWISEIRSIMKTH